MKKTFAIVGILVLAVLFIGGMTFEDKFTLKIYQWAGLDSDEPFAMDMLRPNDMWNMEVGNEGGKTYIQQRRGLERILGITMGGAAGRRNTRSIFICQIDGDSERVVIAGDDENIWRATGTSWVNMTSNGVAEDTAHNFILFKDTLITAIGDSVHLFAIDSLASDTGLFYARTDTNWEYNRLLLHQDRVYGYGINKENNTEIAWMPEFDINFGSEHFDSQVALGFAGTAQIDKDAGDFLTNVVPMGEHLMAYMSRSIYKILISPTANKPVEIIRFAENIGCYGYDAVTRWNNSHYFIAEDGVYENNGASLRKISGAIDYWFRDSLVHSIGTAKVFKIAVYDNKLFATLPKRQSGTSWGDVDGYRTFVYDFDTEVWSKWRFNNNDGSHAAGAGAQEEQFMLRYEYNPYSSTALTGSQYLQQRLLIVRDSAESADGEGQQDRIWLYPSDTSLSTGGQALTDGDYGAAYYKTALVPLTDMWKRKRIERVLLYGEATVTASDSAIGNVLYLNNEDGVIDSLYFSITSSPFFFNKRFSTAAEGDFIGIKLEIRDTNRVKINALELVGMETGMGNETD